MKNTLSLLPFAFALLVTDSTHAQSEMPVAPLETVKIRDGIHVVHGRSGYGSNVGVSIGDDGILLIDAMNGRHNEDLLTAVRSLSDLPVRHVLNTHSDQDHAGGNTFFAEKGATIFGQENARYSKALVHAYFAKQLTLSVSGERVEAHHVPSHSHNDALIHLPESNVIFMGDTFTNTWHATFYSAGMTGQFEIIELALSLADDETVIVPGHGVLSDREGLLKYRKTCADWLARVSELRRKGLDAEAIAADAQARRVKESFLVSGDKEIPEDRYQRFIRRTISTELVPRYPLNHSTALRYVGRYRFDDDSSFEVIDRNGTLFARNPGEFLVELIPVSETRFHLRGWIGDHFRFHTDASGSVESLTHESDDAEDQVARRIAH